MNAPPVNRLQQVSHGPGGVQVPTALFHAMAACFYGDGPRYAEILRPAAPVEEPSSQGDEKQDLPGDPTLAGTIGDNLKGVMAGVVGRPISRAAIQRAAIRQPGAGHTT